jgi:hypothetical protein
MVHFVRREQRHPHGYSINAGDERCHCNLFIRCCTWHCIFHGQFNSSNTSGTGGHRTGMCFWCALRISRLFVAIGQLGMRIFCLNGLNLKCSLSDFLLLVFLNEEKALFHFCEVTSRHRELKNLLQLFPIFHHSPLEIF